MEYKVRARWTDAAGREHVANMRVVPPGPVTDQEVLDYAMLFMLDAPEEVRPPCVPELEIVGRPQPETQ